MKFRSSEVVPKAGNYEILGEKEESQDPGLLYKMFALLHLEI